jgi:hypothetical protein
MYELLSIYRQMQIVCNKLLYNYVLIAWNI